MYSKNPIPCKSDVKKYLYLKTNAKLFSEIYFELYKIIQKYPEKQLTIFDKNYTKFNTRIPRKIGTIINGHLHFVKPLTL